MAASFAKRVAPVPTLLAAALAVLLAWGAASSASAADAASTAAPASAPSAAPPATPGPPPGIPSALFSMAAPMPCNEQLCFWTSSNEPGVPSLTATRNRIVMINPDIVDKTHGLSHITAQRAEDTGADTGNSQIVLTGEVHADMAQGQFSASNATILIIDKRIASIVAKGSPAQFLRKGPAPTPSAADGKGAANAVPSDLAIHGHADTITYDLKTDSVQLNGDSWLTDGCNEFTSQRITYNLMSQTVQAGPAPGAKSRVYGTIRNTRPGGGCATTAGKS